MKQPHKHAALIKAWADGAEIEYWNESQNQWKAAVYVPGWFEEEQYRIKPERKPDVVRYVRATPDAERYFVAAPGYDENLRLTFDGETGKLKKAEVLE